MTKWEGRIGFYGTNKCHVFIEEVPDDDDELITIQELYDILGKFIDDDLGHLAVTVRPTGKYARTQIKNKYALVCDTVNSLEFEIEDS